MKESSQLVDNSSYYQSVRESIAEENEYRDMPLQMGVARSRQRSVRLKEEGRDKYQQELERVEKYRQILEEENKLLKAEVAKTEKSSSKLREAEKSSSMLSGEVQGLRSELRAKSSNIESLEKQFKAKIEDYCRLQRVVEGLNDELALERKRVRNFEELYQNIQNKRNLLANSP